MKRYQLLLILGGIVLVIGIGMAWSSFDSGRQLETFSIPAGSDWHYYFEVSLPLGGAIQIRFSVLSSGTVDTFVFDATHYGLYAQGGSATPVHSETGSTGDYAVTVPRPGTYYVVFEHGAGFDDVEQRVQTIYRVVGVDPVFLGIGASIAIVGVVLAVAGIRAKRKEVPSAVPPTPSTVKFFEPPRPPG